MEPGPSLFHHIRKHCLPPGVTKQCLAKEEPEVDICIQSNGLKASSNDPYTHLASLPLHAEEIRNTARPRTHTGTQEQERKSGKRTRHKQPDTK